MSQYIVLDNIKIRRSKRIAKQNKISYEDYIENESFPIKQILINDCPYDIKRPVYHISDIYYDITTLKEILITFITIVLTIFYIVVLTFVLLKNTVDINHLQKLLH